MFQKYFRETKKFYYSIFFVIPFLIVYEVGLFKGALGTNINGADAMLRIFYYFINNILGAMVTKFLVAFIIIFLLGYLMYYFIKHRVKLKFRYFLCMAVESMALAFVASLIIHWSLSHQFPKLFLFVPNDSIVRQLSIIGLGKTWPRIVGSVGAGIFEELVFRVFFIRFVYGFFRGGWSGFGEDTGALIKAVGASSLTFTLMHLGLVANPFGLISIFFGSILFSIIYLKRGYGVVAGTHIFYDVYLMFGIIS